MAKSKLRNSVELLLDTIFDALHEKKAEDILLLDLTNIKGTNFDYFVITHGNSTTQVGAIAEDVRRKVKTVCQQNPAHAEGFTNAEWVLLDYLDVVVHVFQKEVRDHYQLENLWADAIITPIEEEIPVKKSTPVRKEPVEKTPVKKAAAVKKTAKAESKKTTQKESTKTTLTKTTKTNERKSTKSKSEAKSKPQSTRATKTKI
ncbi:MAG: ribosome silencing factor [Bacteroidales bacterium]|jgi:ribosome-associated protein|nr:ribosome silencing factor [Bacteroidales bacterium]